MSINVVLKNVLADCKSEMIAAIVQNEVNGYKLGTLQELITLCESKNPRLAYEVMAVILETECVDAILHRFATFMGGHPYLLTSSENPKSDIARFQDIAHKISASSDRYSQHVLAEFVATLEELFAHGYFELRNEIYALYQKIETPPFACNEEMMVQKQLAAVYQYNGRNYLRLRSLLEDAEHYCKQAKLKHLRRMIHYYHAVLCVLSGSFDEESHLDIACQGEFYLANILRDHCPNNSKTTKLRNILDLEGM